MEIKFTGNKMEIKQHELDVEAGSPVLSHHMYPACFVSCHDGGRKVGTTVKKILCRLATDANKLTA